MTKYRCEKCRQFNLFLQMGAYSNPDGTIRLVDFPENAYCYHCQANVNFEAKTNGNWFKVEWKDDYHSFFERECQKI